MDNEENNIVIPRILKENTRGKKTKKNLTQKLKLVGENGQGSKISSTKGSLSSHVVELLAMVKLEADPRNFTEVYDVKKPQNHTLLCSKN